MIFYKDLREVRNNETVLEELGCEECYNMHKQQHTDGTWIEPVFVNAAFLCPTCSTKTHLQFVRRKSAPGRNV